MAEPKNQKPPVAAAAVVNPDPAAATQAPSADETNQAAPVVPVAPAPPAAVVNTAPPPPPPPPPAPPVAEAKVVAEQLFKVKCIESHECKIGGTPYHLAKGHFYEMPESAVAVLQNAFIVVRSA